MLEEYLHEEFGFSTKHFELDDVLEKNNGFFSRRDIGGFLVIFNFDTADKCENRKLGKINFVRGK